MTVAVINAKSRDLLEGRLPEGVEPLWYENDEHLLKLAPQAEIAWLDPVTPVLAAQFIAAAGKLVWYTALSSGVDWLPLQLIAERDVQLTNGSGIHAQSVAEYAVMGMLTVAKGWRQVVRAQDRHAWLAQPPGKRELLGSKVLVVGAGEIGGRIAEILRVFGADVTGVRRRPGPGDLGSEEWRGELGRFDWVIAIVPSTPETQRMFGEAEFAAMKPGAVFLNFARGSVIQQDALLAAIDSGHLGGAFLDVTEPEPLPAEHPLWSRENIHVSMHLAGRAQDTLFERGSARFLANLKRFMSGEALEHRVDLSQGY
ncbi:MAG: D-2-hydroxyacid dehydrogenase [Novosphingobium lindaniclasticum]|jgi:phosphoglycerate dehydrogenase-like enzyme|uniref:D-2-hydroxyacid dehydrogenase n=1 Tax=Novosphingobium lindaniclasticum TaxID=1329895 RepID=UPI0024099D26|nr:D-2-hydroxyacid dehydrogenase [Novosphingobium lindaniclasticum]MDF2639691.1 D-2-hydroxyacid dehydrogenase [Novosphingobium lindaniclasticum]